MADERVQDSVLWITGAGSGMGQAAAISAARAGYRVAISGRRPEALAETGAMLDALGAQWLGVPADVGSDAEVDAAVRRIEDELGVIGHAVFAAGLNVPDRFWANQSLSEFSAVVDTNLTAVARCAGAILPGMRRTGSGMIVLISSWSAWRYSPGAGVAYSASKTALGALSEQLNGQENVHGIRACHLCPGDVDTPFLSKRPVVPEDDARRTMLSAADVARAVQFVLDSPPHVSINELVIAPTVNNAYIR